MQGTNDDVYIEPAVEVSRSAVAVDNAEEAEVIICVSHC